MEWVWGIYRGYIAKELARAGIAQPTDAQLHDAFLTALSESTVTVLVQEPWQGSVRFKGLARYGMPEALVLLEDPMSYLLHHFGGGKFKLNFHRGWHFVATHNFKPEGEPRWKDLPAIGY